MITTKFQKPSEGMTVHGITADGRQSPRRLRVAPPPGGKRPGDTGLAFA